LTDLTGGRIRLSFEKSENCISKIILKGLSWPFIILDSLQAWSKSCCPLLDSAEAQCILVMTLFMFGDGLYVGLPAKTIVSNHGSLLEKEVHSSKDKHALDGSHSVLYFPAKRLILWRYHNNRPRIVDAQYD
jgi:hypothetical protein